MKKYTQTDELQKLINWEVIMPLDRYAGGHDEQMKLLFKDSELIAHWNEGDYQGQVATCVKLSDGRYIIYNDYYGSCSGCDAWEFASDEEVKKLCIDLANGAYIFKSLEDVIEFLSDESDENTDGNYDWFHTYNNPAEHLLEEIKKIRKENVKTFQDLEFKPHPNCEGKQAVIFFDNNYGVSVVRFKLAYGGYGSYTDNENEWELAVLFGIEDDWQISYSTDITDDVLGHLTEKDVTNVMKQVQELK